MTGISTHVLDTSRGEPARGLRVLLERSADAAWIPAGEGLTDGNGRIAALLSSGERLEQGAYRLIFDTGGYFKSERSFYPEVTVEFFVEDPNSHHHIPLLLSPYGYTTYRGN